MGALYVLDEPSIGLHPRDSRRLVEILQSLHGLGNTVLVVEHDREIMRSADHLIDLGPRAGEHGGEVVYQGNYADLRKSDKVSHRPVSAGRTQNRNAGFPSQSQRRTSLEILKARKHNLQNIDVRIPLGLFVCITGVSGSGKSTLVHDVLFKAIKRAKGTTADSLGWRATPIRGTEILSDAVLVDQSPIGQNSAIESDHLYEGIRCHGRDLRRDPRRPRTQLRPGHFSFNLAGGRCETCQGNGTITVEMQFLADVELTCDDCKGTRFKSAVLEVRYKGKNIAEVLDLTVHEAIEFLCRQHAPLPENCGFSKRSGWAT